VEAQTAPDQMWESMSNQYDQQAKQIQQAYARTYSQADNQLLSRGMGRSSYGGQVLANIGQQEIEAQTQNHNDLIAAYQNWLSNYNTQQEQFQWEKDQAAQQIAMSYISAIAAKGGKPSDALLAQAGLSRSDYNAMKYKAPSGGGSSRGGGGSYRPTTTTNPPPANTEEGNGDDLFNKGLNNNLDIKPQAQTRVPTLSNQPSFNEMANYSYQKNVQSTADKLKAAATSGNKKFLTLTEQPEKNKFKATTSLVK